MCAPSHRRRYCLQKNRSAEVWHKQSAWAPRPSALVLGGIRSTSRSRGSQRDHLGRRGVLSAAAIRRVRFQLVRGLACQSSARDCGRAPSSRYRSTCAWRASEVSVLGFALTCDLPRFEKTRERADWNVHSATDHNVLELPAMHKATNLALRNTYASGKLLWRFDPFLLDMIRRHDARDSHHPGSPEKIESAGEVGVPLHQFGLACGDDGLACGDDGLACGDGDL